MRRRVLVKLVTTVATVAVAGSFAATASAERLVAMTDGAVPSLVVIDSATPGTPLVGPIPLLGFSAGENLAGIDYRPSNGILYALTKDAGNHGHLYTVEIDSGGIVAQASPVGLIGAIPLDAATEYGVDWNPVVDRLRVVSNLGLNLRIDPSSLVVPVAVDTPLDYPVGDPNAAEVPAVTAIAYNNNSTGATATTLYDFDPDPVQPILSRQGSPGGSPISPNQGQLFTVRTVLGTFNGAQGFDITAGGRGFAAATNLVNSFLFDVDPTTTVPASLGTNLGEIGTDVNEYRHLSVIPAGTFSIDDIQVDEAAGGINVVVHRRGGAVGVADVDFTTVGVTATAGSDFTATGTTLSFADGQTEDSVFVPVAQDARVEGAETVLLSLSNPTNGTLAGGGAILTIDDDDANLSVGDVAVSEAAGTATVTVTRANSATGNVSVNIATAAGSAGAADFTASNATLNFGPGVTQQTLTVPILDDDVAEGAESFSVTLSGVTGQGEIADGNASVAIADDDGGGLAAPSAVSLTSPARGVLVPDRAVSVAATATGGEGGVLSVRFAIDDRTLCVDVTAPYGCDVRLIGQDVGAGTVTATATDVAGRTQSSAVAVFVPRFRPDFVSLRLARSGPSQLPARIRLSGQIAVPLGVQPGAGCQNGWIEFLFKDGRRALGAHKVKLSANCTYEAERTFRDARRLRNVERLRVVGRFTGARHLRPRKLRPRTIQIQ